MKKLKVTKVRPPAYKKPQEKFVRAGWQRYTTYVRKESLAYLMTYAKANNVPVLEVIDDAIQAWIGRR